ncbi:MULTISPECIES: SseB family protein [unclassified Flavobacterium]|uniref:SseB family protein n=1 Tax=unclassified Flavobacterium TaxID=196869 RepID=UPI0036211F5F
MGLFDIFKKKKTDLTFPENELEKCLLQASSDTRAQKAFYQKLLWNQLFVLTADNPGQVQESSGSDENIKVQFVTFDDGKIPVFTSTNRIFDKGIIKDEVSYLSLQGQVLFEITKGVTFVLNPYSEYWKELIPEEIESIMNGTIYDEIDKFELENKKYQEINEIFERAKKRQEGLIILDGYKIKKLEESHKLRLEESINDFQKCIAIFPEHWQSMFLMAKSLQRLERHSEAFEQLEAAFKIELENHAIPLEASLEAMHLKDTDAALYYSGEALKRSSNDYAVMGNHAMNLLLAYKDNEAKDMIEKAIKIHPNDSVNKNIKSIVEDVILGKRKRPTFEDAI